jgi:hypothetical protein
MKQATSIEACRTYLSERTSKSTCSRTGTRLQDPLELGKVVHGHGLEPLDVRPGRRVLPQPKAAVVVGVLWVEQISHLPRFTKGCGS